MQSRLIVPHTNCRDKLAASSGQLAKLHQVLQTQSGCQIQSDSDNYQKDSMVLKAGKWLPCLSKKFIETTVRKKVWQSMTHSFDQLHIMKRFINILFALIIAGYS